MLRGLLLTACRWLQDLSQALARERVPAPELFAPSAPRSYHKLERVVLAEGVVNALFEDFAEHRAKPRGDEEIGCVLLGLREEKEIVVLATLPAGADRQAGVAHVLFNRTAQAVGAKIVRQDHRRLAMVGVVHTHPGSLRHPSEGDFQGDSLWVGRLRGGEGVFGIGTADGQPANGKPIACPSHMQALHELCFSWYALGAGDKRYRRLPVHTVPGPDLARPLHAVWETIELHADALDGLCQQLARVVFEVLGEERSLMIRFPLADTRDGLRILLRRDEAQFFLDRDGELISIDPEEPELDRAVYLVLAELARQRHREEVPQLAGKVE
jgi:proteasome lid subunit RPN8/RPN11